jgi:signal peptidase
MSRNAFGFDEPQATPVDRPRPAEPPAALAVGQQGAGAGARTGAGAVAVAERPATVDVRLPATGEPMVVVPGPARVEVPDVATGPLVGEHEWSSAEGEQVAPPVPVRLPAAPSRPRRALRTVRALVLSGLFGAVVAAVLVFLVSIPLGYRSLTVMSGSMVPTLGVGDVVMERQVAPLDVRVGDIVTFRDPTDQSTLITHRVRSFKVHDGIVDFVTKGDANNTVEKWTIPVSGKLGLVKVHIPKVGYALVWASGRNGRIALIAIPGVILGALELMKIWRPRRSPA